MVPVDIFFTLTYCNHDNNDTSVASRHCSIIVTIATYSNLYNWCMSGKIWARRSQQQTGFASVKRTVVLTYCHHGNSNITITMVMSTRNICISEETVLDHCHYNLSHSETVPSLSEYPYWGLSLFPLQGLSPLLYIYIFVYINLYCTFRKYFVL